MVNMLEDPWIFLSNPVSFHCMVLLKHQLAGPIISRLLTRDSQLYAQLTVMHSAWIFSFGLFIYLFIYQWTDLNNWQWPFLFLVIQQSWWLSTYSFSSKQLKVCALAGLLKMILILMFSRWDSPMSGEESPSCSCPHMSWSKLLLSHSMRH